MLGALQAFDPDAAGDGSGGFANVGGKKQSGTRGIILRVIPSNENGSTIPPATGANATQASDYVTITPGTSALATIIKGSTGRLFDVMVTTQGTSPVMITDGIGGPIIGMINANATPGRYPFNSKAYNSINIPAGTNYPGLTVNYA